MSRIRVPAGRGDVPPSCVPTVMYPESYADGHEQHRGLDAWFNYYNYERRHSALDKRTPAEVFHQGAVWK